MTIFWVRSNVLILWTGSHTHGHHFIAAIRELSESQDEMFGSGQTKITLRPTSFWLSADHPDNTNLHNLPLQIIFREVIVGIYF